MICYYIRTGEEALDALSGDDDAVLAYDQADLPAGVEIIDIDKAYDAIAWLASPVKRAQTHHSARLVRERDWPHSEVLESVARLNGMEIDDVLAAVEGQSGEPAAGFEFSLAAVRFPPDRVHRLAAAVCALDEDALRQAADFAVMDQDDVQPWGWLEGDEGEAILTTYVLPRLRKLKAFYVEASRLNQMVVVVWA
jgi:hypothetical protein